MQLDAVCPLFCMGHAKGFILAAPWQHSDMVPTAAGFVLSHAPLMGADPALDDSHAKWLHIHVRPPVPGLLRVIKASSVGSTFSNLGGQLQVSEGRGQ